MLIWENCSSSCLTTSIQDSEGNANWGELLKFMFDCCNDGTPQLKESALSILNSVSKSCADIHDSAFSEENFIF